MWVEGRGFPIQTMCASECVGGKKDDIPFFVDVVSGKREMGVV